MQQLPLFSINETEVIHLRVAFVTQQQKQLKMRAAVLQAKPVQCPFTQAVFWGEAVQVGQRKPKERPKPVKQATPARAPASVFDLATLGLSLKVRLVQTPLEASQQRRAVREEGVTRCIGAAYPSNRWTPEREEQEKARRARQKPPRPPKGAKTRSRKLLELVGDDD